MILMKKLWALHAATCARTTFLKFSINLPVKTLLPAD